MSETRICLNCGKSVPDHRQRGAKYCNDSCKARYHEKKLLKGLFSGKQDQVIPLKNATVKKEIPKPILNISEGLRGVIDPKSNTEQHPFKEIKTVQATVPASKQEPSGQQAPATPSVDQFAALPIKVETVNYKTAKEQIDKIHTETERVREMITACDEQMQRIKNEKSTFLSASGIVAGGIVGYEKTNKNPLGAVSGAIAGLGTAAMLDSIFFAEARKKAQKESLEKLECKKSQGQDYLNKLNKLCKEWEDYILTTPQYETKVEMQSNFFGLLNPKKKNSDASDEQKKAVAQSIDGKSPEPLFETKFPEFLKKTTPVIQTNDNVISSRELKAMKYKCLSFQSRWKEFFGQPAVVFHLAVHGKPGQGKSTFCVLLAQYLAENFGEVMYISAEEGFSKTLQQKIILTKADSPHLFFADYKNYDEIKEKLEHKYHFVLLDSLDVLKIDPVRLRELRTLFPNSAFITVSQSTKTGQQRGSLEIVHDASIVVEVVNGIAITTKNRFKEKDMRFNIFEKIKSLGSDDNEKKDTNSHF
jgi:DNA replication protein DnaC